MENQSHDDSNRENVSPTWIPQLGMTFSTLDEAWKFWGYYGGRNGFSIRQRYKNKSNFDGKFTSCKYVCSKEGIKAVDKRDNIVKNPRAETRTGCPVRMTLSINREVGNWAISDLFLEHNHILQLPKACHLPPSQRMISEVQTHEIEIADASGIAPKAAHEFASQRVGGPSNLSYTHRDHKNHLRTKCQRDLKYGEAGSMIKYFQDRILKRWTREARAGSAQDSHGRIVVADPKVDAVNRTNFLSHKFYNLMTEACNSKECCVLIENTLDTLTKDMKERLLNAQVTPTKSTILLNAQMSTPSSNNSLAATRLNKKEVNKEDKSSKRRRSWTEKQHKGKKIGPAKTTAPLSKQGKKKKKKELKTKENHPAERTLQEVSHEYAHITNFTELLNMPSSEPSIGEDIF